MIVFFDATCPFCIRMVSFFYKHDKKKILYFAPLKGKTAQKNNIISETSLVFLCKDKDYRENEAVYHLLQVIGKPWSFFRVLFYSNFGGIIYRFIARHRFLWSCLVKKKRNLHDRLLP